MIFRIITIIIITCWSYSISLATPLIASLDSYTVAISIDFTGNEVLLFGSVEDEGEVVVLVRGPRENVKVRKKHRNYGIWHNAETMIFNNVPSYYAISYSGKTLPNLSQGTLRRHEIGAENLNLIANEKSNPNNNKQKINEFRTALIQQRLKNKRFSNNSIPLERLGSHLFRTSFFIPANAPVGTYRAEVFLVKNNKIINAQATPLFVSKTGVEAQIYNIAHKYTAFYGLMAIVIAALAGYAANAAMRKR